MSFISNLFSTAPAVNPAPTPAANPAPAAVPVTTPAPVDPMALYEEQFRKASESKQVEAPNFSLDPKVVNEVAGGMNFLADVPPDIMTKAEAGDIKSILQLIQHSSRRAYAEGLQHSAALTGKHLDNRSEYDSSKVKAQVQSGLVSNALADTPNYDNLVVRSEINRIAGELYKANPDANPSAIAKQAQDYFTALYQKVNPAIGKQQDKANEPTDWVAYLTK